MAPTPVPHTPKWAEASNLAQEPGSIGGQQGSPPCGVYLRWELSTDANHYDSWVLEGGCQWVRSGIVLFLLQASSGGQALPTSGIYRSRPTSPGGGDDHGSAGLCLSIINNRAGHRLRHRTGGHSPQHRELRG